MLSKGFGNDRSGKKDDETMKFQLKCLLPDMNMIYSEIVHPIWKAFASIGELFMAKLLILIAGSGLSDLFALSLFSTPSDWWKGLVWLVLIDWASGVFVAIIDKEFDWAIFNQKWRQVIGYISVCSAAAILSNTFPEVFYYAQFVVYVSFYLKEARSVAKTFRVFAFIKIVYKMFIEKNLSPDTFAEFKQAVDQEATSDEELQEEEA